MFKKLFFSAFLTAVLVFVSAGCGNGSCTTEHSYGTNSFTKNVSDTCFKKIAEDDYYKGSNVIPEVIEKAVSEMMELELVFNKDECRDSNDKTVECPDFIPKNLKMEKLVGCKTYSVDPHTDCDREDPALFFETGDDYFKILKENGLTIYKENGATGECKRFESESSDGKVLFYCWSGCRYERSCGFYWSENGSDDTEIKKSVSIRMELVDPNAVEEEPVVDEDSLPDEP